MTLERRTPLRRTQFKRKVPVNTARAAHPSAKPRAAVKKVSTLRSTEQRDYDALRAELLPPDTYVLCEAGALLAQHGVNVCTGRATELHHRRKRSSTGALANPANCLPVCNSCNTIGIEDHPDEAKAAGLVIRQDHPEWEALSARAWRQQ